MSKLGNEVESIMQQLKTERDELKVKLHLAKQEARDEWQNLERDYEHFCGKAKVIKAAAGESSEDVWQAVKNLGEELKHAYQNVRRSL